ncbi:MAG TPA: ribbon-helix-helix domain-containing protein [Alphaproteobacteria bacterium]|nr:ribbon-helix-helix domain-containing protein [Alphaproteobacteria bacterium]HNS44961.1 ribbon-helix-helix domain-containing protein [Alphaproteobacteria bacterium]
MSFPDLSAPVIKRSVNLAGHSTSVSLEQPFWDALAKIAERDGKSLSALILEIDEARSTNLSSALRLYVLYRLNLLLPE